MSDLLSQITLRVPIPAKHLGPVTVAETEDGRSELRVQVTGVQIPALQSPPEPWREAFRKYAVHVPPCPCLTIFRAPGGEIEAFARSAVKECTCGLDALLSSQASAPRQTEALPHDEKSQERAERNANFLSYWRAPGGGAQDVFFGANMMTPKWALGLAAHAWAHGRHHGRGDTVQVAQAHRERQ